ncbi:hypothetical protein E3T54_13045 [Cryobacterium sp. Sr8]|nr:hypothetical protein E3T54_13045 [Cryobacterium sp. Sr8]
MVRFGSSRIWTRSQTRVDENAGTAAKRQSMSSMRRHVMGQTTLQMGEKPHTVEELEDLAFELRSKLLHLCGTYEGAAHIGGDLSVADILTALYHYGLNVDPTDIANPERDRFVLSKGHAAVCMYIAMAMRGFFSYEGIVSTYGQLDSALRNAPLQGSAAGCRVLDGVAGPRPADCGRHGAGRPRSWRVAQGLRRARRWRDRRGFGLGGGDGRPKQRTRQRGGLRRPQSPAHDQLR